MELTKRELINEIKEVLNDKKSLFGGDEEIETLIIENRGNKHIISVKKVA